MNLDRNTSKISGTIGALACLFFISLLIACNTGYKNESNNDSTGVAKTTSERESVPDSIVQFLITSAATDFHTHQPPTPVDFRKMEIGYMLTSGSEKLYVLCGEYLSQEKAEKEEWETFATIKTSGYEQYLGGSKPLSYCVDAVKVMSDEAMLSTALKNKLEELRSEKK